MEQRPAAMLALDAAQIDARSCARAPDPRARRDSGAAGRIRTGSWRRLPARRPSGRRRAVGAPAPARRDRCRPRAQLQHASTCVRRHRRASAAARIARPQRALDRRRQAGVGPVAGEEQVGPLRSRAAGRRASSRRRRGEGRALLLHDPPGRHRPRQVVTAATSRHSSTVRASVSVSISWSAALTVTDRRS